MKKIKLSVAICAIASMGAGSVFAESEAASVKLGGGVEFTPFVDLGMLYDDNVTHTAGDQIESWVTVLAPSFMLSADNGVSAYNLNYTVTRGEYKDSSDDNYTDHAVEGSANWELNARNRFTLAGSYLDGHEQRGTGYSQGLGELLDEPDRYQNTDMHAVYGYGAETARGGIELEAGTRDVDYEGGDLTQTRDRGIDYGSLRFSYNTGGKTKLLAEVNRRDIAYDFTALGSVALDSSETDILVGMSWEGTAKTTGSVKVGAREKKFDDSAREEYSSPAWEVGVRWEPRTYSAFELKTARRFEEARGAGDFVTVENISIGWGHSWAERFSTELAYSWQDMDYEGIDREEENNGASLHFNYEMRRWLTVTAGFSTFDQDSNVDGYDYDRTLASLGFRATL